DLIKKVAATDVTVLITGESGTGKELVARAIHEESPRREAPFVALNCAAIPKDLIESELFGYKKGAFTGATRDAEGKFQFAAGGTLLLDEIGDMSLDTQAKVLRALENRKVTPLGSGEAVQVNVRIIAATNQDLKAAIHKGDFREDLYYRIRVVEIPLPSLRERGPDILLVANHFLKLYSAKYGKTGLMITPPTARLLNSHPWPGNVRELRNVMESLVVLSTGSLDEAGLQGELVGAGKAEFPLGNRPFREAKRAYVATVERSLIRQALERTGGNITRAAELMGMKRQYLQQKLKELQLDARDFAGGSPGP
ncbi:MAG: sigma-54 interaction domain-containing protein, partial [Fidelibacterota bacterium]